MIETYSAPNNCIVLRTCVNTIFRNPSIVLKNIMRSRINTENFVENY